jgi:hypothetical protein
MDNPTTVQGLLDSINLDEYKGILLAVAGVIVGFTLFGLGIRAVLKVLGRLG